MISSLFKISAGEGSGIDHAALRAGAREAGAESVGDWGPDGDHKGAGAAVGGAGVASVAAADGG